MNMMKTAIVQNTIIYGGRLAVIVKIIEALNQRDIKPDLICLEADMDPERIWDLYGVKIAFNLRQIQPFIKRLPAEVSILAFNMALRQEYAKYDCIIDSNNTSFLMPCQIPVLSYIHYPRIVRLKSRHVNIHHPEGLQKDIRSLNGVLLNFLSAIYSFQKIKPNNLMVANSNFTKKAFQNAFPTYNKPIPIIYPPVNLTTPADVLQADRGNTVCSAGRFCPEKNQMGQIRLAQRTPDYQFNLVGFTDPGNHYYQKCKQYCQQNQVKNVSFYPNISSVEKKIIMQGSKFFIHPNINEPFGITTVEAILSGCIPLVHNSGGQKEIVPNEELRFDHIESLHTVFKDCQARKGRYKTIQASLIKHCRDNFTADRFRDNFNSILDVFQDSYLSKVK